MPVSLSHCPSLFEPSTNNRFPSPDTRWLDWFDSKIAVLINRIGVDPRDYGGKDQQEWVHLQDLSCFIMNSNVPMTGNSCLPQSHTSDRKVKENTGASTARNCSSLPRSLRNMSRTSTRSSLNISMTWVSFIPCSRKDYSTV